MAEDSFRPSLVEGEVGAWIDGKEFVADPEKYPMRSGTRGRIR